MNEPLQLKFLLPILIFLGIAIAFGRGLFIDTHKLPSALLDLPAPQFDLPPVEDWDKPGLASSDLKGEVSLVNIFASWCAACIIEHPQLMKMAEENDVPIYGINMKDEPENARAWLKRLGDPYGRIGADRRGRVSIDFGVYGVPETFVIDKQGVIRYRHVGPITIKDMRETMLPLIEGQKK